MSGRDGKPRRTLGSWWRGQRPRDRGVALLVVITWLALMTALVGQFTYGTTVDAAQAANARDELRAHYMARSAVNLSRLLIKIQQQFVEPVMNQAQQMLKSMLGSPTGASGSAGSSAMGAMGISLRLTDYAGMLMGFFSGSQEEASALGSLIGLNLAEAKGLGMKSGRFDAEILPEDGKIDLNCGTEQTGDLPVIAKRQMTVFRLLTGLTYSQRYERLFSEQDGRSQFYSRLDVARALIDWADPNEQLFSPDGSSGGAEDYRYDGEADRYRAHDAPYDSLEEIKQVRGVTDAFYEAFAPYLTVYKTANADCKLNLGAITNKVGGDCTPIVMGVIRAAAMGDPSKAASIDPSILDDQRLYPLATILCDRASASGFDSVDTVMSVITKPETAVLTDDPRYRVLQGMRPLAITKADLDSVAYVGAPRSYRIVATGESGKVKRKITAIVETKRPLDNPVTLNMQSEMAAGVLQYWREE